MRIERQLHGQVSSIPNQAGEDPSSIPDGTSRTKRVSVQLSKKVLEQLESATDRPGVGKSMVIEAALERFLSPTPPIEELMLQYFDQIRGRLDCFESDIQIIAETVALHARYHLTVMPPLPESEQREACLRGDERFRALVEQVDRRLRLGRSLMRETIDRLNAANLAQFEPEAVDDMPSGRESGRLNEEAVSESNADIQGNLKAVAREGGSTANFRHLPNSFCTPS